MANTQSLDLELASSQYASVADTAPLSITGDLTLMAWVKLESDMGANAFEIISKWDTSSDRRSYSFQIHSSGYLILYNSSDGINVSSPSSGSNYSHFASGQGWYHVAVTLNAVA